MDEITYTTDGKEVQTKLDDKDNITIVMRMHQKAMEALALHREKKEQVISENTNKTPIVTPDELREDMYR